MKCGFWKGVVLYLLIGILWGVLATGKGFDVADLYDKENPYNSAMITITNTFGWPISLGLGIYKLINE